MAWGGSSWAPNLGLRLRWVGLTLAGSSSTEDANTIITTDFADNVGGVAGRITASIATGAAQYDGLTEGALKRLPLANVATLLGKSTTELTDGSHVLLVRLTPNAEIPRYAYFACGWTDDAVQATITGGVVSVWRNAAADNIQPNIHDGTLDVVPPGGAVARDATTRVFGVLKYDGTMATAFSVFAASLDADHAHGFVAYEPTISKAPTHLAVVVGSNNGAGVTGDLDVTVEIAAVPAIMWPLFLAG